MLKGLWLFIMYFNKPWRDLCTVFPLVFSAFYFLCATTQPFDDKLSEFQLFIQAISSYLSLPFLALIFVKKILIHFIKFISSASLIPTPSKFDHINAY